MRFSTLIFQFPIYLEPGVDRYVIYWQLGAWFLIYRELEDQGQLMLIVEFSIEYMGEFGNVQVSSKHQLISIKLSPTLLAQGLLYDGNTMNTQELKSSVYAWYLAKLKYFTNLDFPEIRGFPFLSYLLGAQVV